MKAACFSGNFQLNWPIRQRVILLFVHFIMLQGVRAETALKRDFFTLTKKEIVSLSTGSVLNLFGLY